MRVLTGFAVMVAVLSAPTLALAETIAYKERVSVSVGQSVVVYGYRGDCGQPPASGAIDLPALKTGTLSVGKAGTKNSGTCGPTPAVEIIFTATTPGRESFEVQGDKITVRVK